jgi:hypothetical protein
MKPTDAKMKPIDTKTHDRITVRMTTQERKELEIMAAKNRTSGSSFIRGLLLKAWNDHLQEESRSRFLK